MNCQKCKMNPAVKDGLCQGCGYKEQPNYFPLRKLYLLLLEATEVGEEFKFMGDKYIHNNNGLLELI